MEKWTKKNILVSDMETASLFILGQIRGVKVASILNNVVEYKPDTKQGIVDYAMESIGTVEGERREIALALESLEELYD